MNPAARTAFSAAVATAHREAPAGTRLLAIGWSTVDTDRTEAAFGFEFEDADPDVALGARCRISRTVPGAILVVLEPDTEGRLAASLARLDEGPAMTWVEPIAPADIERHESGLTASTPGPFGPERRWRDHPHPGRHVFLVVPTPGTIAS